MLYQLLVFARSFSSGQRFVSALGPLASWSRLSSPAAAALLGIGGLAFGGAHPHRFPDPFAFPAFHVAGVVVWTVTGAMTALAMMVIAPSFQNDFNSLSLLITWAFAAALIGAFHSFWGTLFGGLGLGALQGLLASFPALSVYRGVLPLVVIVLVLVWHQRHVRWDASA